MMIPVTKPKDYVVDPLIYDISFRIVMKDGTEKVIDESFAVAVWETHAPKIKAGKFMSLEYFEFVDNYKDVEAVDRIFVYGKVWFDGSEWIHPLVDSEKEGS